MSEPINLHFDRLTEAHDAKGAIAKLGHDSPRFRTWRRRVRESLHATFGPVHSYSVAFNDLPFYAEGSYTIQEWDRVQALAFQRDLNIAEDIILDALQEIAEGTAAASVAVIDRRPARTDGSVFLVHGHDMASRESVARFLERGGLDVTILHEQPDRGRTIIEKFEEHASCSLAVVIMSPDDPPSDDGALGRPRQNVMLELGFFLGALGRERVIVLRHRRAQVPSDYSGVLFIPFEDGGDWKERLAREVRSRDISFAFEAALG